MRGPKLGSIVLSCLFLSWFSPGVWAQEDTGIASYYGDEFAGRPTASGELYDPAKLTAAHPSLRLGIRLLVTNLDNGRQVVVTINDRGPFVAGRILDLSKAAAATLDMLVSGTAQVKIHPLMVGENPSLATATPVPSPSPPPPKISSLPPPPMTYFQMGAFRTQDNALRLVRSLSQQGFAPHLKQAGHLFRVYLQAPEGSETQALLDQLHQSGRTGYLQLTHEPDGGELKL